MPVINWTQPTGLSLTATVWNGGAVEAGEVVDQPYSVSPGALAITPWAPGVAVVDKAVIAWAPGVASQGPEIVPWRPSVSRD